MFPRKQTVLISCTQGSTMAKEAQQKDRGSDAAEDVLQNTSKEEIEKLACGDIEVR